MVTAASTCAAVWLSEYCGTKHTFTVATVGVVTIAAYGVCCAFLTMHEQASCTVLMCHTDNNVSVVVIDMLHCCVESITARASVDAGGLGCSHAGWLRATKKLWRNAVCIARKGTHLSWR